LNTVRKKRKAVQAEGKLPSSQTAAFVNTLEDSMA
jgi:hypothetical protein